MLSSDRLMRAIDVLHLGRERVICCWQVGGILIDPGPSSTLETLLAALDGRVPQALLLTHIHLDHAGASGTLARRFPELEVYVHARGARHLASPQRLLDSASRLYGDEMDRLWGPVEPVPPDRLHPLEGGETLRIDQLSFDVAYTPGHATHHVCYLHDGTAFVGDVGGVRVVTAAPAIPPTPPPDIDLEAWKRSLELVASWHPDRLALTHFCAYDDVDAHLHQVSERLDRWSGLARDLDEAEWVAMVRDELRPASDSAAFESSMQAIPTDQAYAGLRRYWDKRAEDTQRLS